MRPRTAGPDGGVHVAQRKRRVCDFRTWRRNGKDEKAGTPLRVLGRSKGRADLNFPHLQHLPFSTFVSFSPLLRCPRSFRQSFKDAVRSARDMSYDSSARVQDETCSYVFQ